MVSFVRISALVWADVLAGYAMFVLQTYLTDIWKLSLTHSAGIINVWNGLANILPLVFAFFVDSFVGDYTMLLLSSIAYSIGLGFLSMSTPPVLAEATGTCREYNPECIGHTQKVLFYIALSLIAVGMSGHKVSLSPYLSLHTEKWKNDKDQGTKLCFQILGSIFVVIVPIVGGIALPYIKPWSLRFGIPAICTLVATLLFVSGSFSYEKEKPEGSPLTTFFRVVVASLSKITQPLPDDPKKLYETDEPRPLEHSNGLRCLDKAAIILPNKAREEQEKNRWKLCKVREVEEIKIGVRMFPMWMTFVTCALVLSIGNTYFVEQADRMNPKIGKAKFPLQTLKLISDKSKFLFELLYARMAACTAEYAPRIGLPMSMVFSVLCCITAAKVETRRVHVIRRHDLLDKPDETIPMSLFWLLPQFILLAGLDQMSSSSIDAFFKDQAPPSTSKYLSYFSNGVMGLGYLGSVLSVYVVGKISEKGGKPNWFQYTLNKSRLDRYYWTLAALSAVNLVAYLVAACSYRYRKLPKDEEQDIRNEDGNKDEEAPQDAESVSTTGTLHNLVAAQDSYFPR